MTFPQFQLALAFSEFKHRLGSVYTWRTLTGVKLNNNRTQYSRTAIFFGIITKALRRNYTKRKVFRFCLFCGKLRFNHFAQRTSVKSNKS